MTGKAPSQIALQFYTGMVPRTGLEPARLATHAPQACVSTIPPPGHK